ncbi:hypothetical protein G4G27_12935 [Sphingomonas sp. So64.6b]|uniref:DUF3617 domain-containing protein n=1 Tax=Sphingomonas sp. So64.6b TaxID=2997354 RepID=UPI001602BC4C|nr:hypothetical protein [Sphingomonas sp. So64.6b]QNA84797.1 hypothetical protein G4G27_12935 [Sphingomonas sp. So64.6b]
MRVPTTIRPALFGLLFLGGVAAAEGPARAPHLIALDAIEQGQWQLREVGGPGARSLCVADPRILLQLQHGKAQCSRFVVADTASSAIVHYTCPGSGHGRTTITVETGRLFKLQTQGIADGAPFDFSYEARRVGACGVGAGTH